jgi:flavorubredoxin
VLIRRITDDLYYLGGIDRRLERFENLFDLPRGISYNSFLLLDEQTVLFNGVDASVQAGFVDHVTRLLGGRDLDYLVVNHVEPDHIASINETLIRYPGCELVISKKGLEILHQFFRRHDYVDTQVQVVGDGDVLPTGHHKLRFLTAPNVHWPEVTVCFDETDGVLFSADAFGSFGAPEGHLFADQVDYVPRWLSETRRYYANVIGRFGGPMTRLLAKLDGLDVRLICPLHGLMFRTPETVSYVIERHRRWAAYIPENPGVVIVYGTMYNHSAQLADELAARLADLGVANIRVHDLSKSDWSHIISDCFRFSNAVFICTTYNTELHPKMDAFLRDLIGIGWDNRGTTVIGNVSWGGHGAKIAQEILDRSENLTTVGAPFGIKGSFDDSQDAELQALADAVATSLPA